MINFIILDYGNGQNSEVFWGWVDSTRGTEGSSADIFRSDDPSIVSMFGNLFVNLIQSKCHTRIQTNFALTGDARFRTKANTDVINKEGVWYTRAYRQRPKSFVGGRDKSITSKQARSCAIFSIIFQNGKPYLSGTILDFHLKDIEPISHRDISDVENASDKIFIRFHSKNDGALFDGFVYYKFRHLQHRGEDIVEGFYIDPVSARRYNIVGVKVSNNIFQPTDKAALADINRRNAKLLSKLRDELM